MHAGKTESKEHVLGERDALWVDLRHRHFAAASLSISGLLDELRAKQVRGCACLGDTRAPDAGRGCPLAGLGALLPPLGDVAGGRASRCRLASAPCTPTPQVGARRGAGGEADLRNMSKMIQSLPQYR